MLAPLSDAEFTPQYRWARNLRFWRSLRGLRDVTFADEGQRGRVCEAAAVETEESRNIMWNQRTSSGLNYEKRVIEGLCMAPKTHMRLPLFM